MMLTPLYRGSLTALALALFAASCGDDEVLGAPDGGSCSRGSISVGNVVEGKVHEESCLLWNDYDYDYTPGESWSFRTAANTAYIVRLTPIEDEEQVNNFAGDLHVYGRNDAGDPYYATGYWSSYGPANPNGHSAEELIFTSRESERVSIRVQTYSMADTGAYSLEVIACPMQRVAAGATSTVVSFSEDCALLSDGGLEVTPVAFFNFEALADDAVTVTATRTAGDASMFMRVRGPDLDFGCYTGNCTSSSSVTGVGPLVLNPSIGRSGNFTVAVYQQTAGTLTATVGVAIAAPPGAPATASAR